MTKPPFHRALLLLLLVIPAVLSAGCGFSYNRPPTAAGMNAASISENRPAVVFDRFRNPERAPAAWRNIGAGMSEAMASQARREGEVDAWVDEAFARRVRESLGRPPARRERDLVALRQQHENVRIVVTGRVTDFAHTDDLPEEVRRRGLFGKRREAMVAIQLDVVDLTRGRVIASDHVYGVAGTPKTPSRELYKNVSFGSYTFWNSPLGKAAEKAIKEAVEVVATAMPRGADVRVASQIGPRQLRLDRTIESADDRRYTVCVTDPETGVLAPVIDPDSGRPLQARLRQRNGPTRTAFLLGRKPLDVDLGGAVLCDMPETAVATAGE